MSWAAILGEIVAGWLLADLLGGVVHWFEDRIARVDWPVIGHHVVAPNRLHHADPLAFTRSAFVERNWTTWAAVLPLAIAAIVLFGLSITLAVATIGGLISNQVHYWAHRPHDASRLVRALQAAGWLQSQRHHGDHHFASVGCRYCVLTNLLNPLLDQLGVWSALERGLSMIGVRVAAAGAA